MCFKNWYERPRKENPFNSCTITPLYYMYIYVFFVYSSFHFCGLSLCFIGNIDDLWPADSFLLVSYPSQHFHPQKGGVHIIPPKHWIRKKKGNSKKNWNSIWSSHFVFIYFGLVPSASSLGSSIEKYKIRALREVDLYIRPTLSWYTRCVLRYWVDVIVVCTLPIELWRRPNIRVEGEGGKRATIGGREDR